MEKINIVCPHCFKINAIPKKDSYAKANCGSCKNSLLDTNPVELDESNFDHVIVNSDIPVIVDFWAPWCGPCKTVVPALEEASRVLLDINFYKINVDENKDLNSKFGILSIPTIIIMQDDTEVKRFIGNTSADNIISNIISVI